MSIAGIVGCRPAIVQHGFQLTLSRPSDTGKALMSDDQSLLREIDEDLRRERLYQALRKYGPHLVVAVAVVLAVTAGYTYWQRQDTQSRMLETAQLSQLSGAVQQNPTQETALALTVFAEQQARPGIGALAQLEEAAVRTELGDDATADAILTEIAADEEIPQPLRAYARMVAAYRGLDTGKAPAEIIAQVAGFDTPDNPWRFAAREITALAHLAAGENTAAITVFTALAEDPDAPPTLQARAEAMADQAQGR